MNFLLRIIRANEKHITRRITRFHTERDELMPFNAYLQLPKAIWDRITGGDKGKPWIVPKAISWLDRVIQPNWRIFEFGSGWSTLWYAKRCGSIVSLENDPRWYERLSKEIEHRGIRNCDLRLIPLDHFPSLIESFADDYFDLVVVDSYDYDRPGKRVHIVKASTQKVRPGDISC